MFRLNSTQVVLLFQALGAGTSAIGTEITVTVNTEVLLPAQDSSFLLWLRINATVIGLCGHK